MSEDIGKARNWQGNQINCACCAHIALNRNGCCQLKHACVNDRYAGRIDCFFERNPSLADAYLAHPHFEVRAIAARFANVFLLPPLLHDHDETVRWSAVRRLPKRFALQLRNDPHHEVRMWVATLLEGDELLPMASDEYYYVRLVVARRIAPMLLRGMIRDEDAEVRCAVARRLPEKWLLGLINDRDALVRLEVVQRLPAELLSLLRHDPDWRIRHEIASRIVPSELMGLVDDPYSLVREVARSRLVR
ncbi:LRV FeS4 cluster domain-containing protein [Bradyrhizobium sp. CCGUVB4N]|uniref:4Fe4S-binding leucine-rich repeat protein n=1 Tax=Bradyrhizobium sp. CCGUVB4N TaxID=2949631 RepID=UPI0020B1ED70|nr:4Fe4S-binding leucine-rich repeat protein [Bradyrhizobium sp. CCGUVB4N]MCP3380532.1 LRV FeS4 cluster domain-containing protein [Bradyrhizobium sp. CCGUVB4N]